MNKRMTLEQAFAMAHAETAPFYMVLLYASFLAQHDWYYAYSDDHSVWSRGERNRIRMDEMERAIKTYGKSWEEMAKGYYSDLCPWIAAPESLPKDELRAAKERYGRYALLAALAESAIIDIVDSLRNDSRKTL